MTDYKKKMVLLEQLEKYKSLIEEASGVGKTRIYVSPIYEENISEILKLGSIIHAQLEERPEISIDIIYWNELNNIGHEKKITYENSQYMTILKMVEMGI